jgi:hypothetical protein
VKSLLPSPVRDLIAFVVAVLACPIAVFGGANAGCVGHTDFSGSCALTVIFVSPLVLLIGGTIAGIATRGWTGLLVMLVGMVVGMTAILFASELAGQPVPLDWFSAIAATFFFGVPLVAGYGVGRLVMRLVAARAA